MTTRPAVLCRPDDLHIAETSRLWIVTSRMTDYARWYRSAADDPEGFPDWAIKDVREVQKLRAGPIADPLESPQPLLPVNPNFLFFAGIDRQTRHVVSGLTVQTSRGASEIGGGVHRDYRARGYGHEMLDAVCNLVHRHFGIGRLVAGCEVTNVASQRWLAKSGFSSSAPGPQKHKLPNGRVTQALWWERVDPDAELRCRRPRPRRRLFARR